MPDLQYIKGESFGALDVPVGIDHLPLFLLDQMQDLSYFVLADYQIQDLLSLQPHELLPLLLVLLRYPEHLNCTVSWVVVLNPLQDTLVPNLELPLLDELVRVVLLRVSLLAELVVFLDVDAYRAQELVLDLVDQL